MSSEPRLKLEAEGVTSRNNEDPSQLKLTWYTFNCALFAAVGSLLYGIDSGIISTTIAQPTFTGYFPPYTADIAGAVVSIFGAGSFFGVVFAGWAADAWGRKRTIQFAAFWALVAGAIQAGAVHIGMLITGRIIGGFAVGILNMTIPIYNSEIAPPRKRGLVSGLHAQFVGLGFAVANWIGFACSYAKGQFQWRFPLAVQCIPALVLLGGIWSLPYSPRWLLEQGRDDEALAVMKKLNGLGTRTDLEDVHVLQFNQMQQQIQYEKANAVKKFSQIIRAKGLRKRLLLAVLVQVFTQLSGINVINYYQTTLYKGVGVTGHTVTLLAALYGMVGPAANVICLLYIDKWGRKPTMWITGIAMACDLGLIMGFTARHAQSTNKIGQGFTIAFIFCFSIIYSLGYNSIHYIHVPEIMNQAIRARGSSISVCANVLVNIIFNQISPRAFATIGYKYYAVFISTNLAGVIAVLFVMTFLFLSHLIDFASLRFLFVETKGKSLEEINLLFGDTPVNSRTVPGSTYHS